VKKIYEGDLLITTTWGAELWVVGLDEPQRIEGTPWDGCVLDESCDLKQGIYEVVIVPAMSEREGWVWRIGRPKRTGPGARDFRKAFEKPDEDAETFHWPSRDILPAATVDYAMRVLDATTYAEHFDARFQNAGGIAYEAFEAEYNVRPCSYHADRFVVVGSDFNVDPMAWILAHSYENPERFEVFDEIVERDMRTGKMLSLLWDRYGAHRGGWQFYGDASSQSRHTSANLTDYQTIMADKRFREAGRTVHYPAANPGVTNRINIVNAMLKNAAGERRLFMDPRCKKLIESLETCWFKPGTRELVKTGDEHDLTHITDALGYPIHWLYSIADWEEEEVPEEERIG
jgi:hypothetical protein